MAIERIVNGLEKFFQSRTARSEIILPPLSPETQRLVEKMRKDGYVVYDTAGKTPASLRLEGMRFWYLHPDLEDVSAVPALLAFRPDPAEFFLRGSRNLPFEEQLELHEREKARVIGTYPDTGIVPRLGTLSEWTELFWRHFQETRLRLLERDHGYSYTWADTYENEEPGADRAGFGFWGGTGGAHADFWRSDYVYPYLRLASLVEIPRK